MGSLVGSSAYSPVPGASLSYSQSEVVLIKRIAEFYDVKMSEKKILEIIEKYLFPSSKLQAAAQIANHLLPIIGFGIGYLATKSKLNMVIDHFEKQSHLPPD
jgi:hypothetical protein